MSKLRFTRNGHDHHKRLTAKPIGLLEYCTDEKVRDFFRLKLNPWHFDGDHGLCPPPLYGCLYDTTGAFVLIQILLIMLTHASWFSLFSFTRGRRRTVAGVVDNKLIARFCFSRALQTQYAPALRQSSTLLLRPGRGAEYCDQLVCLSVWLSVREHTCISETAGPIFTNFLRRPLWPWLGPSLAALRYVMYFRFYGWRHVWP